MRSLLEPTFLLYAQALTYRSPMPVCVGGRPWRFYIKNHTFFVVLHVGEAAADIAMHVLICDQDLGCLALVVSVEVFISKKGIILVFTREFHLSECIRLISPG